MGIKTTRVFPLREYCRDAWALFREKMRRAPHEEIWGHQCDKLAAAQERSPPH